MNGFNPGDRVRYTYSSPLGDNEFLPPHGAEGTVIEDQYGLTCGARVLFDNWRDPLTCSGINGAFYAWNTDLEIIPCLV